MPTQRAIEIFAILTYGISGLSLLLQPLAWARLTAWLVREGEAGALGYGSLCLLFGSIIVSFHRVWFGVLALLTLVGCLEILKGALFLLAPAAGLRLMALGAENRPGLYRLGGIVSLVIAAIVLLALFPGGF